jgi:hypothetical protein
MKTATSISRGTWEMSKFSIREGPEKIAIQKKNRRPEILANKCKKNLKTYTSISTFNTRSNKLVCFQF